MHPDHTPFTEEITVSVDSSDGHLSRKSSMSTVKPPKKDKTKKLKKTKTPLDGNGPTLEGHVEAHHNKIGNSGEGTRKSPASAIPSLNTAGTLDAPQGDERSVRGRDNGHAPQDRSQSVSARSLHSKASSELRATAPEFVPKLQDELQSSPQTTVRTQWSQPSSLAFDPMALDGYSMPWFFHMYPVDMHQFRQRPKKHKTMQRGRKRQNATLPPNKPTDTPSAKGQHVQDSVDEKQSKHTKRTAVPFASQLDEIARTTVVRPQDKEKTTSDLARKAYSTMPARSGRALRQTGNGLYGTFGRGCPPVGMPIESTVPFPDPVPPSGGNFGHTQTRNADTGVSEVNQYARYVIEQTPEGCGTVDFYRAADWVAKACNSCEPDH